MTQIQLIGGAFNGQRIDVPEPLPSSWWMTHYPDPIGDIKLMGSLSPEGVPSPSKAVRLEYKRFSDTTQYLWTAPDLRPNRRERAFDILTSREAGMACRAVLGVIALAAGLLARGNGTQLDVEWMWISLNAWLSLLALGGLR